MPTRIGSDYPPRLRKLYETAYDSDGDQITRGRYPVINVTEAWEAWSMLGVIAPGLEHHYREDGAARTALMLHAHGSWARATSANGEAPIVHQSGPRRLWDLLDDIRDTWLRDASLPLYGANATISPDGAIHLRRGRWQATIT